MSLLKLATPFVTRVADVISDTINSDNRTVEVVFSTQTPVQRRGFNGESFLEVLSHEPNSVHLERLKSGAPLLKDHQAGLENVIGVIENAWVDSGARVGKALVRFDDDELADRIFRKVKSRILRSVSVGYTIEKARFLDAKSKDIRMFEATSWTPLEVSIVSIPADASAIISMSQSRMMVPLEFELIQDLETQPDKKETRMENSTEVKKELQPVPQVVVIPTPEPEKSTRTEEQEGLTSSLDQIIEINKVARGVKLSPEVTDRIVKQSGGQLEKAKSMILDEYSRSGTQFDISPANMTSGTHDQRDHRREAMLSCILNRCNATKHPLSEAAKEFRYSFHQLGRMAEECLRLNGNFSTHLPPTEILARALTTSDFQYLMMETGNRLLMDKYTFYPRTFLPFIREVEVKDYREQHRIRVGEAPLLVDLLEDGEIVEGSSSNMGEKYKIYTKARLLKVSDELLVNDDLGGIQQIFEGFGQSAAVAESNLFWSLFLEKTSKPHIMGDGKSLFHKDHGNIAPEARDIDIKAISDGYEAMMTQKSMDGHDIMLTPQYLVVPIAKRADALQFISKDFLATQMSNVNIYKGELQVIAEPRLDRDDRDAWYLFASQTQAPMVEYGYLAGRKGVYMQGQPSFTSLGFSMRAVIHFNMKPLDWRPFYRNPGVPKKK